MRARAFMAGERFARLRREIARIERGEPRDRRRDGAEPAPPLAGAQAEAGRAASLAALSASGEWGEGDRSAPDAAVLPFAIPRLDRALAGGLARAALHEMRVPESRDTAAMTGFAAAVLARLAATHPLLWIVESAAANEAGSIYGVGLGALGLDPARLVTVRVKTPADALWVFEEGLRCAGLAAVVTEIRGNPRLLDLTASRRLALRAAESGVMGLLLRQTDRSEPGAATTRWLIAPRPASTPADFPAGIGHPAWRLVLERNRHGSTGTFDVEWDHDRRCFLPAAPALSRPVASHARDRPSAPPAVRPLVA